MQFLSTPSARRATLDFIHSVADIVLISIHALREEGDSTRSAYLTSMRDFYPRPPRGGRRCPLAVWGVASNFYPRPPRGGRPVSGFACSRSSEFLSTPSARRATFVKVAVHNGFTFLSTPSARRATEGCALGRISVAISIHALREEGDLHRSPQRPQRRRISIHALREEGDFALAVCLCLEVDFYPRPPRGGRQQKQRQNLYFLINYTTFCTNLEEL